VNQIFNRLAFSVILLAVSIVLAGIIVGSSLTAGADAASFLMNQAILRFGLFLCVVIVIGLIISMFRGRKPR
jgi:ubiquinone biosynthesis protein